MFCKKCYKYLFYTIHFQKKHVFVLCKPSESSEIVRKPTKFNENAVQKEFDEHYVTPD